jgi:hypothetical protein
VRWPAKRPAGIRLCLELFVTFCFKAKSKERKEKEKKLPLWEKTKAQ